MIVTYFYIPGNPDTAINFQGIFPQTMHGFDNF